MTTDKDTLIQDQKKLIQDYKDLFAMLKDREAKAADYLASVAAAIKNKETRQLGLDHLDRYIAGMKERNNVAS
jgi:hypothetical protein